MPGIELIKRLCRAADAANDPKESERSMESLRAYVNVECEDIRMRAMLRAREYWLKLHPANNRRKVR